jgi:hypothetical protein
LKTKCWVKIECARRTTLNAPEGANEADNDAFGRAAGVAMEGTEM